jgi:glycosyltransferase involved in cell wall biosynthesis
LIRVLHFADIINRDDFIHNILEHCDPASFAMSAATLDARGSLNADPGRLVVTNVGCRVRSRYPEAVLRLRHLIRKERVHIVHAHHYEPTILAALSIVGLPVALVMGRHYSDAIYELARGVRRRAYLAVEDWCHRRAAAIVVPSLSIERLLRSQGVDQAKVRRIPYGLDFRRFGPKDPRAVEQARKEWLDPKALRLATFGRLHAEKGHRFLLPALRQVVAQGRSVSLIVAGDGVERPRLEAQARDLGVADHVRFLGWRKNVLELMAAADIVVQPTLHEAFSQVMIESMSMGRPLIMSEVSGVEDVIEHGRSGLIVPPRDSGALVQAILALAEPATAARIGAAAAARVRTLLAVEQIVPRFEAVYRDVFKTSA